MSERSSIPDEILIERIHEIRGQKVMLDRDLADLYDVETRKLNQQVRRNPERFPEGFMFQLTDHEWEELKAQSSQEGKWGGRRYPPRAFTEHGALMLSNVLNSDHAIQVSVRIIQLFTRMRQAISDNEEIMKKLEELEAKDKEQDERIEEFFAYVKELRERREIPSAKRRIGYRRPGDEGDEDGADEEGSAE